LYLTLFGLCTVSFFTMFSHLDCHFFDIFMCFCSQWSLLLPMYKTCPCHWVQILSLLLYFLILYITVVEIVSAVVFTFCCQGMVTLEAVQFSFQECLLIFSHLFWPVCNNAYVCLVLTCVILLFAVKLIWNVALMFYNYEINSELSVSVVMTKGIAEFFLTNLELLKN
jgi:hypothetical protein